MNDFGNHVFISYSHDDTDTADKIREILEEQNYDVWIDWNSLTPGTYDWQMSIREAIEEAYIILFLASPTSSISKYVAAELAVSNAKDKPVIPVWVRGDEWVECIPLDMIHTQYVEFRHQDESQCNNLVKAIEHVVRASTQPFGEFPVDQQPNQRQLPWFIKIVRYKSHMLGWINILHYVETQDFLDDLYVQFVSKYFAPYTYGREWILTSGGEILASFDFLTSIRNSNSENASAQRNLSTPKPKNLNLLTKVSELTVQTFEAIIPMAAHIKMKKFLMHGRKSLPWVMGILEQTDDVFVTPPKQQYASHIKLVNANEIDPKDYSNYFYFDLREKWATSFLAPYFSQQDQQQLAYKVIVLVDPNDPIWEFMQY